MIIDYNLRFNNPGSGKQMRQFGDPGTGQVVTASAAGDVVIDQQAEGDAVAIGAALAFRCVASKAGEGECTIRIALQTCDTNTSSSVWKTLLETGEFAGKDINAGEVLADFRVPQGCKRFLRAYYTVSTASGKTCKATVNSFLTKEF